MRGYCSGRKQASSSPWSRPTIICCDNSAAVTGRNEMGQLWNCNLDKSRSSKKRRFSKSWLIQSYIDIHSSLQREAVGLSQQQERKQHQSDESGSRSMIGSFTSASRRCNLQTGIHTKWTQNTDRVVLGSFLWRRKHYSLPSTHLDKLCSNQVRWG